MSEDEQTPAATFEEAFRDVQPRPHLEATLMARHPELQKVKAERVRPGVQQEEEQANFSRGITHMCSGDGDVAILDEAMAMSRSGHFIQNSSKLDYFCLVATSPANHILKTLRIAFGS
jgi:hypothetical protein